MWELILREKFVTQQIAHCNRDNEIIELSYVVYCIKIIDGFSCVRTCIDIDIEVFNF